MEKILELIKKELKENSDEQFQKAGQRYFKETINLYGIKAELLSFICKKHFKTVSSFSKTEIFNICEELFKSGFIEESIIACKFSYYVKKQYQPSDFKTFETWVYKYVNNWAVCDTFCNNTIGIFMEKYPEFLNCLESWAKSDNMWARRAAAVSLIVPARKGIFTDKIIQIADLLLLDKEDLVQKGYGWMLKSASQKNQDLVFNYVMKHKNIMPRTALRYAIEKLPANMKTLAMQK